MEEKILNEITKLEEQYNNLNKSVNDTVNSYNDQIKLLQAEGQAKVNDLMIQREGTFKAIESLKQMLSTDNNEKLEEQVEESKSVPKKEDTPKRGRARKEDTSALTKEELINLSNVIEKQKVDDSKAVPPVKLNNADIPDYLKDEYNK